MKNFETRCPDAIEMLCNISTIINIEFLEDNFFKQQINHSISYGTKILFLYCLLALRQMGRILRAGKKITIL